MTYFQLLPASATRGKHYAEGGGVSSECYNL